MGSHEFNSIQVNPNNKIEGTNAYKRQERVKGFVIGTNGEIFNDRRGSNSAFNLGNLTNLFFESHAGKKVLHTSFNGFVGILVQTIHDGWLPFVDRIYR